MVEMPASEENEFRQAFGFDLRYELFRPPVEVGASLRQRVRSHPVLLHDCSEGSSELRIAIVHDDCRLFLRAIGRVVDEPLCLFADPLRIWMDS